VSPVTPAALEAALAAHDWRVLPALPGRTNHRPAGVLVPVTWDPRPRAVLTLRAADLRRIWWKDSPTLGLRERRQGRWVLPRRRGSLSTPWGELAAKQTLKPDGTRTAKPERDALHELAHRAGLSPEMLWQKLSQEALQFDSQQEWTC